MNSKVFSTLRPGLAGLVFGLFLTPAAQAQPDVTLLRNGSSAPLGTYTFTTANSSLTDSYVFNNGLIQFTWGRDDLTANGWTTSTSVDIQSCVKDGVELCHNLNGVAPRDQDRGHSFYIDAGGGSSRLAASQVWVLQNTSDMAELVLKDTTSSLLHEHHIFMRRGHSGLYGYTLCSCASNQGLTEVRFNSRWDHGILDHIFNWTNGPGMTMTYWYCFFHTSLGDETWKLDGVNNATIAWPTNNSGNDEGDCPPGFVWSKYDWSSLHFANPIYGHFGHNFGAWHTELSGITDKTAWSSDGHNPLHQDLFVHQDSIILDYLHGGHYSFTGTTLPTVGRLWGPWYTFVNTAESTLYNTDHTHVPQLIKDATDIALAEIANCHPYLTWLTNQPRYATTARTTVIGRLVLATTDNHVQPTDGMFAFMSTQNSATTYNIHDDTWYVKCDADGYFTIPGVPTSTSYYFYAQPSKGSMIGSIGATATTLNTTAMGTTNLGTITWTPVHNYNTFLWQLGRYDRLSSEFGKGISKPTFTHSSGIYYPIYGNPGRRFLDVYNSLASLSYTMGLNWEPNDFRKVQGKSGDWTINFNLNQTYTGTLHVSTAYSVGSVTATVLLNGTSLGTVSGTATDSHGDSFESLSYQTPVDLAYAASLLHSGSNALVLRSGAGTPSSTAFPSSYSSWDTVIMEVSQPTAPAAANISVNSNISKVGTQSSVDWQITINNTGAGPANDLRLGNFTITPTSGSTLGVSPAIVSVGGHTDWNPNWGGGLPTPITLSLAGNSSVTYDIVLNGTACDPTAAYTVVIPIAANGSQVGSASTLTLTGQSLLGTVPPAPPILKAIAPDTGISSTDQITSATNLTFNGTSQAFVTSVTVSQAGTGVIGTTTTVDGSGNWTFDYTGTTLADGVYTFTAIATNAYGDSTASNPFVVTVDTVAPASAPTISGITGSPMVITGTAAANDRAVVTLVGTGVVGTAAVDGSGNWTFTYTNSVTLDPNTYTFTAVDFDPAGNGSSPSAGFVEIVGASPPVFTGITPDTGSSSTDLITNATTLTLNGSAARNGAVQVTRADTGIIGTATANGSGAFSFDYTGTPLVPDGLYTFTAIVTAGGQTSSASSPFVVTVDTVAAAPVMTINAVALPVIFSGTAGAAEAGATVAVTQTGTGVIGSTTALGDGSWSFTYNNSVTLIPSIYTFTAAQTDVAGNTSAACAPQSVTIAPPPPAPVITGISPDTGVSSTDGITNSSTFNVIGTAQANAAITLFAVSNAVGTATADGSGNWSISINTANLYGNTYAFTAVATNVGGNSPVSTAFNVTYDPTAPTVTSSNRQSPTTAYVAPAGNVTYQVIFSEAVSGVTTAAFTLTGSGTDTGTIATVTAVNTSTYNVAVNNIQGALGDTVRLDVNGTGVADIAGNALGAVFTAGQTYTIQYTGNGTWINAVSGGVWGDATNWSGNVIATGTGNTANFSTLDLTADNTVHLLIPQTVNRLIYGDTDTTTGANWILDNNGNTANTMTLGGTAPGITVNALGAGNTAIISTGLAGTAGIAKLGVGTLVLSGANTISGAVTIGNTTSTATAVSGGIIRLDTGASLTASTLTIGPIGTLGGANAGVIVNGGTLVVTGATALNGGAGVIAAVPARNIIEVDSGTATFTGAFATTLETSTLKITGGTVTFSSTLNFFKSASNSGTDPTAHSIDFSGTAGGIIITGGNVTATGAVGIGRNAAGAAMIVSGGTTTLNSTLLLANGISTVNKGGGLRVTGGTLTVANTATGIVLISKGTSILNNFAVAEFAGGVSTVGKISIAGDTSQTTGIGQVYVDGGTLYIGAGGIATPAGTSAAPGTYLYSVKLGGSGFLPGLTVSGASNVTMLGGTQLTGDGILGAAASWTSAVRMVLGGNTTLQAADAGGTAHNITLSGNLSGAGGLVKTGGGTLTLSGNSAYTGATVVNAGTLQMSGTGTSAITLNSGASLAPGTNGTVGTLNGSSLTWNGNSQVLFDLAATSDTITLTGALTKGAAGTYGVVLSGGGSLADGTAVTLATFASTNFSASDFTVSGGPAGGLTVNATNLQFTVNLPNGSISGNVTDASSAAISGATVSVVVSGTTYAATTASDGTYTISGVPKGTGYTVTVSAPGYQTGTDTGISVTSTPTTGVNFALSLAVLNGTITGTVKDSASVAVSGAAVSTVVSGTTYATTTASDGTYSIANVPAGSGYTVTASAAGFTTNTATGVTVTAGQTTSGVNITLTYSSYAGWLNQYPGIGGPAANPSGDGVSNELKYAFNMNPTVSNRSGLPVLGTAGGFLTITYTVNSLATDVTYSIQASTDMATWTTITPSSLVNNGNGTMTATDTAALTSSSRRFLRVQVSIP